MIEQALESQKRGDQNQFRQVALYEESKAQSMPKNEEEDLQERKRMKELAKIRQLELDLANVTKVERQ